MKLKISFNTYLLIFCLIVLGGAATCPANCQTCNQNGTICTQCNPGYQFNDSSVCTLCNITGCIVCNQANVCDKCNTMYTKLTTGLCANCNISNCNACSSNNICMTCSNSLLPSTNGQCICPSGSTSSLPNCAVCTTNTSCSQCSSGFQLYLNSQSNYVCINCNIANCVKCMIDSSNSSNVICQTCMTGYSATTSSGTAPNTCVACTFPCATCNTANLCATCLLPVYFSMPLSNGNCIINKITNCNSYSSTNSSQCSGCVSGYTLNSSNYCVFSCPANCQSCSNNNNCTTCNIGFYINGNNSCTQCNTTGSCKTCNPSNPSLCNVCISGYFLTVTSGSSGNCMACPTFCSQCTSASSCTALTQSSAQVLLTINGQSTLGVCQQSCMICSVFNPQQCNQCMWGFYLNNNNCLPCNANNCKTCNTNSSACDSCFINFFAVNNTCVGCNSNCLTCQGSTALSTCTSCNPTYYLVNNTCKSCSSNCLYCSSATVCTECLGGFVQITSNGSVVCAICITGCVQCAQGIPNICLSCATGYYLNTAGSCTACNSNCNLCTAAGCTSCISGYFLNPSLTCSVNCVYPCSTCSAINPTKCITCIAGYMLNSNACSPMPTCNGSPCSVCPFGYSLSAGLCTQCSIQNCRACSKGTSSCDSCIPGYYLNTVGSPSCNLCPNQCATCLSSSGCITCSIGYTIALNAVATPSGFQCMQCMSPCFSCLNNPMYCTSCLSGYQLMGTQCVQTFTFSFGLTLGTTMTTFDQNYIAFVNYLVSAIGASSSNTNAITLLSITSGSVIINGQAAPSGPSGTQQSNNQFNSFQNALSQNTAIAGMSVTTSTVTVNGGTINFDSGSNKLAIILGVCIPVGVIIIVAIILIIYCKKKKSSDQILGRIKEDDTRKEFQLGLSNKHSDPRINRQYDQKSI